MIVQAGDLPQLGQRRVLGAADANPAAESRKVPISAPRPSPDCDGQPRLFREFALSRLAKWPGLRLLQRFSQSATLAKNAKCPTKCAGASLFLCKKRAISLQFKFSQCQIPENS